MKKIFLTLIIFLTFINYSLSNERKIQLDKLFERLQLSDDDLSYGIEQKIWELWSTHPSDQNLTSKLREGSKLVRDQQLIKAKKIFSDVIKLDPEWAEAWNKRATVLYLLGDYQASQNDIDKVLILEKRHFGALAGQGLVNIKLENFEKAIESYKKAQEIYPAMQSPKIMIDQIKELIKRELI